MSRPRYEIFYKPYFSLNSSCKFQTFFYKCLVIILIAINVVLHIIYIDHKLYKLKKMKKKNLTAHNYG